MSKHYEVEFRKKIVRLHLEEGRTLKGLAAEYGVPKGMQAKKVNKTFKFKKFFHRLFRQTEESIFYSP